MFGQPQLKVLKRLNIYVDNGPTPLMLQQWLSNTKTTYTDDRIPGQNAFLPTSFPGSFISRPPPPRWKSLGTRLPFSSRYFCKSCPGSFAKTHWARSRVFSGLAKHFWTSTRSHVRCVTSRTWLSSSCSSLDLASRSPAWNFQFLESFSPAGAMCRRPRNTFSSTKSRHRRWPYRSRSTMWWGTVVDPQCRDGRTTRHKAELGNLFAPTSRSTYNHEAVRHQENTSDD